MRGTYISIWGYVVMALVDNLDVYAEWDWFQEHSVAREEDLSERKEIFIETLMQTGKVNPVTDAEVLPEKYDNYFEWFFMKADPKAGLVPSAADMKALRLALGNDRFDAMSVYDRELFATGYKSDLMQQAEMHPSMYFMWVAEDRAGSQEDKKMQLFRSWFARNQRMATEKQGFAVENVFSNDPKDKWGSYSYTSGASKKLGYDVALVNAGRNSGGMLAQITTWAIETGGFMLDVPFEVPGYTVGPEGKLLHAVAVEISPDSALFKDMTGALNQGMTKAVQVYIGDKNNILPTEEGYDTSFVQEYTS